MPDDPNNRIEEQLKAWAQKRREETGPPFELHSATRKQFQDEVARTYSKPAEPSEKKSAWLALLWPRLVWALPTLGVCLVAAALLLPSFAKSKSKGRAAVEFAHQDKKALVEDYDKGVARREAKPGEFIPARDEYANGPATAPSPAPTVAPPASVAVAGERSFAEVKDTLDVKLEAGREVAAERDARREVERALGEKAKEAPPLAQAAPVSRGVPANDERSELIRQRYGLQPAPRAKAEENVGRPAGPLADRPDVESSVPAREPVRGKAVSEAQVALDQTARGVGGGGLGGWRLVGKSNTGSLPALSLEQNAAKFDQVALALKPTEAPPAPGALVSTISLGATVPTNRVDPGNLSAHYANTLGQLTQRFSQVRNYRRNLNSPPMPNVLSSFQFEQIGQQIRIVDDDGSTYEGQIETPRPVAAAVGKTATQSAADELKKFPAEDAAPTRNPAVPTDGANALGQNLWFRVSGTNRTLNQPVVFVGNLLAADTNLPSINGAQAGVTLAQPSVAVPLPNAAAQSQVLLQNARVQGQATVGANSRIEINAVPTPQRP